MSKLGSIDTDRFHIPISSLNSAEKCTQFEANFESKYTLLDIFMCSIAEYSVYQLCCILSSPQGESKYKQRVKILSGRYYTSKRLISDLLSHCFHLLAFLIVSVVKTLKNLKNLCSARAYTHSLRKNFSVRCENCLCRKLPTKKRKKPVQMIDIQFAKIRRNNKNNIINQQPHNYSN